MYTGYIHISPLLQIAVYWQFQWRIQVFKKGPDPQQRRPIPEPTGFYRMPTIGKQLSFSSSFLLLRTH